MRVYLDMCCLKRPFDDQSQPRIHLESEAVLSLLAAPNDMVEFVRSAVLDLENEQNPLPQRAAKVRMWLDEGPRSDLAGETIAERIRELVGLGFKTFDAAHVATAEAEGAETLCTCDDQLLAVARRQAPHLQVRIANPVDIARELLQ